MKTLCLIFGVIFLINGSTAQYSYVYEIRHDNKPKNEAFGDSSLQYKTPSEMSSMESSSGPDSRARDFAVKSPEVGPTLLNIIRNQLEKSKLVHEQVNHVNPKDSSSWSSSPDSKYGQTSSLALQSNNESPIYAKQPLTKSYVNELPLYVDKYRPMIPKESPILESRPQKEEREPKLYEQRPVYTTSYPYPIESMTPTRAPRLHPQEKEEKLRTVHQIQTPNYRIQLVSKPESLDKLMPLLEQYELSHKPFQTSPYSSHSSHSSHSHSSSIPSHPSPHSPTYRESAKPLMLSVEPDSQLVQPSRHNIRSFEDSRQSSRPVSSQSIYDEKEQLRTHSVRHYPAELKPEPRPILELPKQELPPQMKHVPKGRFQMPPPEPRYNPIPQIRSPYSSRPKEEYLPTALFQINAPDLGKRVPHYSRVQYSEEDSKNEEKRPVLTYTEEPTVYRLPEGQSFLDLQQQFDKLREDPSIFDKIKAQSVEMSDKSQKKYRKDEEQPMISTDPNYKPSPIPDEYKPFTQTRYYKTFV